jgi:hypothetical protein
VCPTAAGVLTSGKNVQPRTKAESNAGFGSLAAASCFAVSDCCSGVRWTRTLAEQWDMSNRSLQSGLHSFRGATCVELPSL